MIFYSRPSTYTSKFSDASGSSKDAYLCPDILLSFFISFCKDVWCGICVEY